MQYSKVESNHVPDSFVNWPIPAGGRRIMLPLQETSLFDSSLTSKDLYPNAAGFSPAAPSSCFHTGPQLCSTMYYCAAGSGVVYLEDVRTEIGPGDFFVIPRCTGKVMESDSNHPWSLYWVRYEGELEEVYTPLLSGLPKYYIGIDSAVVAEFEQIFQLIRSISSHSERIVAAAQLKHLIAKISCILERHEGEPSNPKMIARIQEIMLGRIDEDLDLNAIASLANLSKYHFSRIFKQHTGTSPLQYFMHLKMEKASQLLDRSAYSIKQIAATIGLSDQHYFSRVFRLHMGMSPTCFRQKARQRK